MRGQAVRDVALSVTVSAKGSPRCFETAALLRRIAYYRGADSPDTSGLRLELEIDGADSAELRVYRRDEVASRRRFAQLPSACSERRDAVALASALALEGAARELAQRGAARELVQRGAASSPGTRAESAGARGPGQPGASRSTAAEVGPEVGAQRGLSSSQQERGRAAAAPESSRVVVQIDPFARSAPARRAEPALRVNDDEVVSTADAAGRSLPPTAAGGSAAEPAPLTAADPEREDAAEAAAAPDVDVSSTSAAAARQPADHVGVHLHLGGRWLNQALPAPVWVGALGAELWLSRHFAIDLAGFASTLGDSAFGRARAQAWLTGGELLGCAGFRVGPVAAQGCLGATAAACRASGVDFPVEFPAATLLWAATLARFSLRWPAERTWSIRLSAQSHVSIVRPELRADGASERLSASLVGGLVGLDVMFALR
ncbi:MAG: hypothetical protein ABW321_33660 [Polyangiales bacterium]